MSEAQKHPASSPGDRVEAYKFPKGKSGNPGGRPKSNVVALARAHTQEAIDALVLALKSPKERVPAATALLDRGWGKPVQMITGDPDKPVSIAFTWSDASAPTIDAVPEEQEQLKLEVSFETNSEANEE